MNHSGPGPKRLLLTTDSIGGVWTYTLELARVLLAADLVAAPTRAMLSSLERHYGPLPRSCVVPNGRDPARFTLAPKEPFIFAMGRLWNEAKNIGMLDKVAPTWLCQSMSPARISTPPAALSVIVMSPRSDVSPHAP